MCHLSFKKITWQRPEVGWLKVNTDASFVAEACTGAGGVVIRGDTGRLLNASARTYAHVPDVLTAEAMAARDGVLLARACGYEKVILELDNLSLVNLLRSEVDERSAIVGLCHEIRELGSFFTQFRFSFVNREGNGVAHVYASLPSESSPAMVWSNSSPAVLATVAESDCNPAFG